MPRHAKPVTQHVLEGTFRPGRHAGLVNATFDTLKEAPPCPASVISKKAKEAWATIIPQLAKSGRLAPEDIPGLEVAFRALGIALAVWDTIQELDPVNEASKIRMLSSVAHQNAALFIDILARFGFSSKGREGLIQTISMVKLQQKKDLGEEMTT